MKLNKWAIIIAAVIIMAAIIVGWKVLQPKKKNPSCPIEINQC